MIYRFTLRKKSRQIKCPSCGKRKFTPYFDVVTNVDLDPETCGRCSRENSCGYHFTPRELFLDRPELAPDDENILSIEEVVEEKQVNSIEEIYLMKFLEPLENNLTKFLYSIFDKKSVDETLSKYLIGYEDNMVIFWQIDSEEVIRTGKKMLYHEDGKRDKFQMILMHQDLYEDDFVAEECFFGEHLLTEDENKGKVVKIVESEKTALICDIVFPEFIWIATGGKHKWLEDEWFIFEDREVVLVPDEDAIEDWDGMREDMELQKLTNISIDDVCRGEKATSDIADLILENFLDK